MQPPELVNMFAVPFSFSRYPGYQRLNSLLKIYINAQEQSGAAANPRPLSQRNAATFESHFNLFRASEPSVQELKAFCWNQMLSMVARLNNYDLPTMQRLQIYNDCWFHVIRRGGFVGLQNHPNSSWSGIYCVDPGQHDAGKKESGLLSFVNPMMMGAMHRDAGISNMTLPYGFPVANVALDAGQLVIFPSWVLHDVKPFEGEGERTTIAFNCSFSLPEPA